MLQQLHLKLALRGGRLAFPVLEPLSQFVKAWSDPNWCTIVEDLRTWILDNTEDHWVPTLGAEKASDIMTEDAYAA